MPRSDAGVARYDVYADGRHTVEGVACLFTWLRSGTKRIQVIAGDYRPVLQILPKGPADVWHPWVDADGTRHDDQLPPEWVDAMGPAVYSPIGGVR